MLWFFNSALWSLKPRAQRTAEILMQVRNTQSLSGSRIVITGSSNGGYTFRRGLFS